VTTTQRRLSAEQIAQWARDGYLVVPGVLEADEREELGRTFQAMHDQARRQGGEIENCFTLGSAEEIAADPLKLYPRMLWPHRHDPLVRRYMLHPRLGAILRDLLDEEPLAAQSMFYWKPPGSRGQAFHQDNFYLRVKPGTCVAAWMPLDRSDEENGGLVVVPGTHDMEIVCPEEADPAQSFTRDLVPVPAGCRELPIVLEPGDALFFNGSLVHGSYPNRSADRFRRAFICHYFGASAEELAQHDRPALRFDGRAVDDIAYVSGGGPCGAEAEVH
jgi:ectoine hydroxylase-related dioxygenase (phytanoyl-CoA dioxygenase family)